MSEFLPHDAFKNQAPNLDGFESREWFTELRPIDNFEDMFRTNWWRHHTVGQRQLVKNDIVKLINYHGRWDVELRIVEKVPGGGLKIWVLGGMYPEKYHGKHNDELHRMCAGSTKTLVNYRWIGDKFMIVPGVEAMDDGTFRVKGNELGSIHKSGIKTEKEADEIYEVYLENAGLREPSDTEREAFIAEKQKQLLRSTQAAGRRAAPAR